MNKGDMGKVGMIICVSCWPPQSSFTRSNSNIMSATLIPLSSPADVHLNR